MERLQVAMNDLPAGVLTPYKDGAIAFQYHDSWLAQPGSRAISLSLPLRREPFQGAVVNNFFDNLLPDSTLIQARFHICTQQPFDLLASIGMDCIGVKPVRSLII